MGISAKRILMGMSVSMLAAGLLLHHAQARGQAGKAADANLAPIDCGSMNQYIEANHVYSAYVQARKVRRQQAIATFDWNQKPAPGFHPDTFDPLSTLPAGVTGDIFQLKTLMRCQFPVGAELDDANFRGADLTGSIFKDASLKNAIFDTYIPTMPGQKRQATNLSNVRFTGTDLTGASFSGADVAGVVFEPEKVPTASDMYLAKNLSDMTYQSDPSALSTLRQEFRDGGFAVRDREITYAINRRQMELSQMECAWWQNGGRAGFAACLSFAGAKILDLTCQFGLNLMRPAKIGVVAWLFFAFSFFLFMHHPGPSGLYLAVAEGIVLDEDAIKNAPQVRALPLSDAQKNKALLGWVIHELKLFRMALYFSLVNCFNIGFKDADIGRWLHLLPPREFDFRAIGWARTFAGIQALLTMYLLTIWVLCFLGHPFG